MAAEPGHVRQYALRFHAPIAIFLPVWIGYSHLQELVLQMAEEDTVRYRNQFANGQDLLSQFEDIVEKASDACEAMPELSPVRECIEFVQDRFAVVLPEPRTLFKYDNNTGNVLVKDGCFAGFIDFEECFIGTHTVFLGAVLDCLHKIPWDGSELTVSQCPPWRTIRAGWERCTGQSLNASDLQGAYAMALLNAWRRVAKTLDHARGMEFWGPRHRMRLDVLWSYVQESAQP